MNNKVAFIDLDGVVASSDARFEQAEHARQQYLQEHADEEDVERYANKAYWKTSLNGEHVHLDTLIDGVPEALHALEAQGYVIIFLTSRPDPMREATEAWLQQYGLLTSLRRLDMKPLTEQWTKTVKWKIDRLVYLAEAMVTGEVLLVDDEVVIRQELERREVSFSVKTCSSLEEALTL